MKKIIRLTESDIHRIVEKSVNRILTEACSTDAAHAAGLARYQAANMSPIKNAVCKVGKALGRKVKVKGDYARQASRLQALEQERAAKEVTNAVQKGKWNADMTKTEKQRCAKQHNQDLRRWATDDGRKGNKFAVDRHGLHKPILKFGRQNNK